MEGAVYAVDRNRVAKIWFGESEASLQRVRRFYNTLSAKSFQFEIPRIHEVHRVEDRCVTIEQRLTGSSLDGLLETGHTSLEDARSTLVDVLAELAGSGALHAARALPVMDESVPLYDVAEDFPNALADLAERRLARFRRTLDAAVEELDKKVVALRGRLHEVDSRRRSVVHGDLILGNILVDEDSTPTAVLDWGFFTTEGDPAFDAAVAASIFDMYGDCALNTELDTDNGVQVGSRGTGLRTGPGTGHFQQATACTASAPGRIREVGFIEGQRRGGATDADVAVCRPIAVPAAGPPPPRPRPPARNKPEPALPQSQLVTAVEAGQIMGIRPDRIRQWASRGYVQGRGKCGRATLYDRDDLVRVYSETRSRTIDSEVYPKLYIPHEYYNQLITTNEVAALFGVAPSTVRSWIRRGHLTPLRRGNRGWLFKIGVAVIAADDRARNRMRRR